MPVHALLINKLITLLILGTEPTKSPDTSMNVWCTGRISKSSSKKSISLAISLGNFFIAKCQNTNTFNMVTKKHLRVRQ